MEELIKEEKREIVMQKMHQYQREIYVNSLNEKIAVATQAPAEQINFIRSEGLRILTAYSVMEEELALLV